MSREPSHVVLRIYKGQTFQESFQLIDTETELPVDLTGMAGRMQVRKHIEDATPVLSLPGPQGSITITPATGTIDIQIPATMTAAINDSFEVELYVYDFELFNDDPEPFVERLMQGTVVVFPEVTR